jgi:hypothetical protein
MFHVKSDSRVFRMPSSRQHAQRVTPLDRHETLVALRSAHHVLAELVNPNTRARPSDIFYQATEAEVRLRKLIAQIDEPAPPCMIESATVDTNNCCLRCGAADGEDCRSNLMPVYAAREAE